jgi:glycosyltransferase involved in cell wall biosynthesis
MKISIVIPAFNEEKYIGRTLESVNKLDTGGREVEVVVVNGGSTDRTAEIAASYGAKVVNEPHKGIGFARQEGLKAAKGEIVVFTDADTIVPSDWLTKHINALTNNDYSCSYGTYRVDKGNFPYFQITNYIQPAIVALANRLGIFLAGGQNIGCRREKALKIGGFDEKLEQLEDADFVRRMKTVGKVVFLPNCVVLSSGRRSKEGWRYFLRAGWSDFRFFILGRRDFLKFPDFR